MRLAIALVAVVLASALAPFASADAAFDSRALSVDGTTQIAAPLSALLALGPSGLDWQAVAAAVTIDRTYSNRTVVEGTPVEVIGDPDGTVHARSREVYGVSRLVSSAMGPESAILAWHPDGGIRLSGGASGLLEVASAADPQVRQHPVQVDAGPGESTYYGVMADLVGDYVNVTGGDAFYELRGTFVLQVFDTSYTLRDAQGAHSQRTGVFETGREGPVVHSRIEINHITLIDATLVIRARGGAQLFSSNPTLDVDGTVFAYGADGVASLAGSDFVRRNGASEWSGAAVMSLTPFPGGIEVTGASLASAQTGAVIAQRTAPFLGYAGALLVAVGLLAAFLVARRRRQEPSLDLALLAMDERRWEDAIEHIDGLLAKGPADPILLVDRAICFEETGRLAEARASCEDALHEAPANAEAHYYYARILARMRVSTSCLAHLSRALALDARLRELARSEAAFRSFHDHPQFIGLVSE